MLGRCHPVWSLLLTIQQKCFLSPFLYFKAYFLNESKPLFLSEKGPLLREPHGRPGAKALELAVSRNQTQGPRHRLGLHPRAGHQPGQGQLSFAASAPLFPWEQDPEGRVHTGSSFSDPAFT